MNRLNNKVAIVTGAAGGIGAAIAKLFAEEGAKVMAVDIQEEKLQKWVTEAMGEGLAIEYSLLDVSSVNDWKKVVDKTVAIFGQVNILINNAGIYPPGATMENTLLEDWQKVVSTNLTGPFIGTQACLPHMRNAGKCAIVNIDSIAGMVGGNGPAYSSSKGGLRLLTKDNAVEFAKYNIRVNSIHPGGVLTPMTEPLFVTDDARESLKNMCPLGRIGQPEEIAYGALYLASDEASYVTGAELVIDGGMIAR